MNLAKLQEAQAAASIAPEEAMSLLGHAVVLGFALMVVSAITMFLMETRFELAPVAGKDGVIRPRPTPSDVVLNAANVLYLCIGMAGMMLLVSNNIARAFAIGAAIALVRFRIKVDSKSFGMSLFYGVLVGMACGVDQPKIGYGMVAVFSCLQFVVLVLATLANRMKPSQSLADAEKASAVQVQL